MFMFFVSQGFYLFDQGSISLIQSFSFRVFMRPGWIKETENRVKHPGKASEHVSSIVEVSLAQGTEKRVYSVAIVVVILTYFLNNPFGGPYEPLKTTQVNAYRAHAKGDMRLNGGKVNYTWHFLVHLIRFIYSILHKWAQRRSQGEKGGTPPPPRNKLSQKMVLFPKALFILTNFRKII